MPISVVEKTRAAARSTEPDCNCSSILRNLEVNPDLCQSTLSLHVHPDDHFFHALGLSEQADIAALLGISAIN